MTSWIQPLLRAVPALVLGFVVTFTADHSAPVGLLTFGIFGVATAVVLGYIALKASGPQRTVAFIQATVSLVAGVAALAVTSGGTSYLVFVASGWAVITGGLELYAGFRARRSSAPTARDQIFVGAITLVLAVVLLVLPPDYRQPLGGIENVSGELTASVIAVGLLGAYWIVIGVFLAIAAFSLKWSSTTPAEAVKG